jgi:hypothetical protein
VQISLLDGVQRREYARMLQTCTTRELERAVAAVAWLAAFGAADLSEARLHRLAMVCAEAQTRHFRAGHQRRPTPPAAVRRRARRERLLPALLTLLIRRSHRSQEATQ